MSQSVDALGDRMKSFYESPETSRRFLPLLPIYARIDGRGFSKFTRGMRRPYDARMSAAMVQTTCHLVAQTHAVIGYTQSDEISLCWYTDNVEAGGFFDRKIMKLSSVLAGLATAAFTHAVATHEDAAFAAHTARLPHFDARVVQLPSLREAANMLIWRNLDATKNAVSMATRHYYSHREMHGQGQADMHEMLHAKGVNFNDYPASFKRGTFVRRETVERCLSEAERARIPAARRPPAEQRFTRNVLQAVDLPKLSALANPVEVLFQAAAPILRADRVLPIDDAGEPNRTNHVRVDAF